MSNEIHSMNGPDIKNHTNNATATTTFIIWTADSVVNARTAHNFYQTALQVSIEQSAFNVRPFLNLHLIYRL